MVRADGNDPKKRDNSIVCVEIPWIALAFRISDFSTEPWRPLLVVVNSDVTTLTETLILGAGSTITATPTIGSGPNVFTKYWRETNHPTPKKFLL